MTALSVVVVSYNTRDLLRTCLASIAAETPTADHEVLVVDNASSDGSATMVAGEFPSVRLLALPENTGFARACNLGVRESSGQYVVLLNPDTVVIERALEHLLAFARANPSGGLYGGRTLTPAGRLEPSSCWAQPSIWSLACFATGLSTIFRHSRLFDPESMGRWPRDGEREVDIVTGCLLLSSRAVWDDLGGFDERFWMYGEDADLCLRARAHGFRPMITPGASITHHVGRSNEGRASKRELSLKGKITLLAKHWPPRRAAVGRRLLGSGVALRAFAARLSRRLDSPWPEVWRNRSKWDHGWPL